MADFDVLVRMEYLQDIAKRGNRVSAASLQYLCSSKDAEAIILLTNFESFSFILENLSVSFECIKGSTTFYFQESKEEFDYSMSFLLQGNFKFALIGLRSIFELLLLGVLFQNQQTIQRGTESINVIEHLEGLHETPPSSFVRKELFKIRKFSEQALISREKLNEHYKYLSNFVHTKGEANSRQNNAALPVPTFDAQRFIKFSEHFSEIVYSLATLLAIQFPHLVYDKNNDYATLKMSQMFDYKDIVQLKKL